jgi:predicted MFS family arabinose efflux permease
LYYKDAHHLSELEIGLLMGLNGFLIFLLEMPLIKWLEESKYSKERLMFVGLFLTGISFLVLNLTGWVGILIVGMLFMTIGEMIAFPFSNAFVMERAKKGNQGEYMAYYSIAFSLAHIFGHNSGMQMVDALGFDKTWWIVTLISAIGLFFLFILTRVVKREKVKK